MLISLHCLSRYDSGILPQNIRPTNISERLIRLKVGCLLTNYRSDFFSNYRWDFLSIFTIFYDILGYFRSGIFPQWDIITINTFNVITLCLIRCPIDAPGAPNAPLWVTPFIPYSYHICSFPEFWDIWDTGSIE